MRFARETFCWVTRRFPFDGAQTIWLQGLCQNVWSQMLRRIGLSAPCEPGVPVQDLHSNRMGFADPQDC
jgi:hypothetical protein